MPFAVALTLDPAASGAVAALWRRLAEAGLSDSMPRLGYPPHVTLGVFDRLEPAAAQPVLRERAAAFAGLTFRFHGLAVFPGAQNVLWLAPLPDPRLLALQAELQDALGVETHVHTKPGQWMPHCTLAVDLDAARLQQAMNLLAAAWQPIEGAAVGLELLRFEPVEVLWRAELPAR